MPLPPTIHRTGVLKQNERSAYQNRCISVFPLGGDWDACLRRITLFVPDGSLLPDVVYVPPEMLPHLTGVLLALDAEIRAMRLGTTGSSPPRPQPGVQRHAS